MSWFGAAWIGAIVGLVGRPLHPSRGALGVWLTGMAAACAALLAKLAGSASGWLTPGGTFEWLAIVGAALVVVTCVGFIRPRFRS